MPEKDISTLVKRYEEAKGSGKSPYFDADEFCDLAEYYDSIDNLEAARVIIDAGLRIHPQNTSLLIRRSKTMVFEGQYAQALEILQHLSDYDFDLFLLKIECHLQLDQYQKAFSLSEELLEKEENEPIESILAELGFLYVEADYFNEAILYLEESLNYDAENIEVLSDLAYAYEMAGNFEEAVNTTNKILDIEPYTYEAWVNLGKLYSLNEQYEKAVDAFDFALTINDSDYNVLKLKGHCLSLGGRVEEALEIFNSLLSSRPEDTSVYFLLSESYQSLEMYDEALDNLMKYKDLEGSSSELLSKEAYLFLLNDNISKALSIVENGLIDDPDSLELNMVAGEIALKMGNYEKAESYYINAYSNNEDNFQLLDRLAIISIKEENYRQAADYTERLLDIDPNNMAVKQRLALLYFEIDDKEGFNVILDQFTDKELLSLFELIYKPQLSDYFDREMLISYLNKAREARTLFKNLEY